MKGSGISSVKAPLPHDGPAPSRERISLDRRSSVLDPRTHAIRPDLADVRLADRIFAPHYAAPVPRVVARVTALREARDPASPTLAMLDAGGAFELLDILGDDAWGIAATGIDGSLVGYLDVAALAELGHEP